MERCPSLRERFEEVPRAVLAVVPMVMEPCGGGRTQEGWWAWCVTRGLSRGREGLQEMGSETQGPRPSLSLPDGSPTTAVWALSGASVPLSPSLLVCRRGCQHCPSVCGPRVPGMRGCPPRPFSPSGYRRGQESSRGRCCATPGKPRVPCSGVHGAAVLTVGQQGKGAPLALGFSPRGR